MEAASRRGIPRHTVMTLDPLSFIVGIFVAQLVVAYIRGWMDGNSDE